MKQDGREVTIYVSAPKFPSKESLKKPDELRKLMFVPYWFVEETHIEDDANMTKTHSKTQWGKIPLLQNSKAVPPNEPLRVFKPRVDKKRPLDGAEVVQPCKATKK